MDAELLMLRSALYTVMGEYYCAIPGCYETTTTPRENKAVSEGIFLSAAEAYGGALRDLLNHLTTLEQTPSVLSEAERTRRLVILLGREMRATQRFISLCTTAPTPAGRVNYIPKYNVNPFTSSTEGVCPPRRPFVMGVA